MQVFLTGGSGYIGTAVLDALMRSGHQVTALVRDPEKAARIEARGATTVLGELAGPARFLKQAVAADAVVHTAFEATPRGPAVDQQFLDVMLPALAGAAQPRAFIYTSGIWVLGPQPGGADETAALAPVDLVSWRPGHEAQVLAAHSGQLRTAVVRPGIVYGSARGIVSDMLKDALNGLVRVIGDGTNRWPCVYDRDLGDLYARIVASADAAGVFHAAGDEDERVLDIAEAIRSHVDPVADIRFMPLAEAHAKMGPYADALALDQVVRCPRARALGWSPAMHGITGNAPRLFEEYRRAASRE
ncbi:MAG TPA: NAD-dependent epimerase/dehydratase family protein [Vicinamibacterales bacterium]|nr:NAD-dependent epimerase/dehydratase family protein [Vicinamibacterales bacterium]